MDTMSNISKEWLQYLDGKITINDIIEAYESRGFDSNQDIPGNYHWEELYKALGPDTKVILTVRDDTERKWFVISRYIIYHIFYTIILSRYNIHVTFIILHMLKSINGTIMLKMVE